MVPMDIISRIKGWIIRISWWEDKMVSTVTHLWSSKQITGRTLNILSSLNLPIIRISTKIQFLEISNINNLPHHNLQRTLQTTGQIQTSTLCCLTTWSTALHSNNWTMHHHPSPKTRANCPSWSTITRSQLRIRQICWKSTWRGKSDKMKRNLHLWKFSDQLNYSCLLCFILIFFKEIQLNAYIFLINLTIRSFSNFFFCDIILSV